MSLYTSQQDGLSNWKLVTMFLALLFPIQYQFCSHFFYFSNAEWLWVNVTCDNKFEYVCKTMQQKRDGVWTEWTEWSVCDRNYIRRRSHVCNNPSPFCGGSDCPGEANEKRYYLNLSLLNCLHLSSGSIKHACS